jgi:hypothetical protein
VALENDEGARVLRVGVQEGETLRSAAEPAGDRPESRVELGTDRRADSEGGGGRNAQTRDGGERGDRRGQGGDEIGEGADESDDRGGQGGDESGEEEVREGAGANSEGTGRTTKAPRSSERGAQTKRKREAGHEAGGVCM